ncbi:hypothetical protein PR202_ga21466 [Eleusine coracana subsp. coracana]|uniref:Uncharacterized protein n=1 Tax=Eleusine coracana subsp. coracana TaxID=191504 RepID=A0AAV5D0X9_ELECO|nr:hypothetical protein PR202_ga21466 [Eleusine coracana subsp. coracana]
MSRARCWISGPVIAATEFPSARRPFAIHTWLKQNIQHKHRARQRARGTGVRHGCRDQHRLSLPRRLLFLAVHLEAQDKETGNNSLPMPSSSVQYNPLVS